VFHGCGHRHHLSVECCRGKSSPAGARWSSPPAGLVELAADERQLPPPMPGILTTSDGSTPADERRLEPAGSSPDPDDEPGGSSPPPVAWSSPRRRCEAPLVLCRGKSSPADARRAPRRCATSSPPMRDELPADARRAPPGILTSPPGAPAPGRARRPELPAAGARDPDEPARSPPPPAPRLELPAGPSRARRRWPGRAPPGILTSPPGILTTSAGSRRRAWSSSPPTSAGAPPRAPRRCATSPPGAPRPDLAADERRRLVELPARISPPTSAGSPPRAPRRAWSSSPPGAPASSSPPAAPGRPPPAPGRAPPGILTTSAGSRRRRPVEPRRRRCEAPLVLCRGKSSPAGARAPAGALVEPARSSPAVLSN
jgi:hypothetical protein